MELRCTMHFDSVLITLLKYIRKTSSVFYRRESSQTRNPTRDLGLVFQYKSIRDPIIVLFPFYLLAHGSGCRHTDSGFRTICREESKFGSDTKAPVHLSATTQVFHTTHSPLPQRLNLAKNNKKYYRLNI
jgi:hypothetical protein